MVDASVIISFYNKIEWLKLVLAGFKRQSNRNFEIIISDDGSKSEVVEEVQRIKSLYPFTVRHIWHEDNGWQKNIILNKSVMQAQGSYLIFIDGDCIPHRHFVSEHLIHKSPDTILTGRRVNLPEPVTQKLTVEKVERGYLENFGLIESFWGQINGSGSHIEAGIYVFKWIGKLLNNKRRGVLGCNFSMYRSELIALNGFDERYLTPAVGEDTDLELRFVNNGGKIRTLKNLAVQYHLYHKMLSRQTANHALLKSNSEVKMTYTPYGIVKK